MLTYDAERNVARTANGSEVRVFGEGESPSVVAFNGISFGNDRWGDFLTAVSEKIESPIISIDVRPAVTRRIEALGGLAIHAAPALGAVSDLQESGYLPPKPHAIGFSWGGAVVRHIMQSHREAFEKGVGISTPTERMPLPATHTQIALGFQAVNWLMGDTTVDAHQASDLYGGSAEKHQELEEKYRILTGRADHISDIWQLYAIGTDPAQAMRTFFGPFFATKPPEGFLEMNGSEDAITPPGRYSDIVNNAGHMVPHTHIDEVADRILRHFRRQ